ncbi:hypothetical protein VP1G_06993 [Cytospora mali]|uniref:PQ loop repeat protein n=1 Tax=Cytospora mali TaxID=578113 RepID=A0A194V724_CYTMA|nr:hypothetical protein VP1G_06993 [Valsa mali var. pyri (nom. inval.)]
MDVEMFIKEPDRCNHLSTPSITQFSVSCILMGWVLISYIPQYARIVSRKSAEGLSTLYILLGSLSGVCAVGNIMMLPSSEVEIGCCRELQRFACISGLLGMFQVIFGIACFWGVLFMYVYYSEEEADAEIHHRRPSLSGPKRTFRRAKKAYLVLLCACAFAFAVMLISAIISHRFPWYSQAWADTLGIAVAVLACVQWVPQTLTTWHLGHLGSLSLASLCLSAPYTWIFGINMIVRVGLAGWSAWVVYILVGTMQLILIAMGVSFKVTGETQPHEQRRPSIIAMHFDGWNASHRSVASSNIAPDERRPLLASPMRHASDTMGTSRGSERRALMSMSPPPRKPQSRDGRAATASPAGR